MTKQTRVNETQDEDKKLSRPDRDLDSDYRPTRYGSTDVDRNKKTEDLNSSDEDQTKH